MYGADAGRGHAMDDYAQRPKLLAPIILRGIRALSTIKFAYVPIATAIDGTKYLTSLINGSRIKKNTVTFDFT